MSRMVNDLHIEATRSLGHGPPDTPHAEDSESFPCNTHSQEVTLTDAISPSLSHDAIIFERASGGGQKHHESVISRAFGEDTRGVCHDEATLLRGGDVDMIESDTTCRPDPD